MHKQDIRIIFSAMLMLVNIQVSAGTEPHTNNRTKEIPSFGFLQEFAGYTGGVSIEVPSINSIQSLNINNPALIRIGIHHGELMIDPTGNTGLGYKHSFTNNVALYGRLYTLLGDNDELNLTLGGAYTGRVKNFLFSGSAEMFACNNCKPFNDSDVFLTLGGAAFYNFKPNRSVHLKISLGGELLIQFGDENTVSAFFGTRVRPFYWLDSTNIILDIGFLSLNSDDNRFGMPIGTRLAVEFF